MNFPSVSKLPASGFAVQVVQIEFSDHLVILISRSGMIGDIVLSQKSILPPINGHASHDVDARTIFGPEKMNSCLVTRLISKSLNTSKNILVSTDFKEDICFSDTQLICDALKNFEAT